MASLKINETPGKEFSCEMHNKRLYIEAQSVAARHLMQHTTLFGSQAIYQNWLHHTYIMYVMQYNKLSAVIFC